MGLFYSPDSVENNSHIYKNSKINLLISIFSIFVIFLLAFVFCIQ